MPTNDNHELLIARIVADFAEWGLGRSIGEPTLNDDGRADALVDVLFEDAQPPIALEVTSIVEPETIKTAHAAGPAEDRLRSYAEELNVGFWYVEVLSGTHINSLEAPLRDFMTEGFEKFDQLTGEDGVRDGLPAGVMRIRVRTDRPNGLQILTWSSLGLEPLSDFTDELEDAVAAKAPKLARIVGYERHLAVDLQARRATDAARTAEPDLPKSIDYLWVIRRTVTATRSRPVVWLASRTSGWRTHGDYE